MVENIPHSLLTTGQKSWEEEILTVKKDAKNNDYLKSFGWFFLNENVDSIFLPSLQTSFPGGTVQFHIETHITESDLIFKM